MAYCRFSTDDFQCDLYVYADCNGGYTIHVSRNRVVFKEPLPEPIELGYIVDDPTDTERIRQYVERHNKVAKMVEDGGLDPINDEHAGQSFYSLDGGAAIALLHDLKARGYRFPDYVIEGIEEDEREERPEGDQP